MEISVQNLNVFEALVQTGNMTQAARQLNLSQPALSWSLRQLEEKVGVALFIRRKTGMNLTKAGETFLAHSRELRLGWERLSQALDSTTQEPSGTYTLGVFQNLAMYTLPRFYPELAQNYPKIDLRLAHASSTETADGVIQLRYDFGLVANPPHHPDLTIVDLYPDEVGLWVAKTPSPLQDPGNPNAVVAGRASMLEGDFGYQEALRRGLISSGRILPTTDLLVVVALVRCGAAIGLLPRTIAEHFGQGELHRLEKSPVRHDVISLIWRQDAQKTRAAQLIREAIISGLQNLSVSKVK